MLRHHTETRRIPYSVQQMFDLVGDVGKYPEFLPWTAGARVRKKRETPTGQQMLADLVVAFGPFRERYTSDVDLVPPDGEGVAHICVEAIDGPFEKLTTRYTFTPVPGGACEMALEVEFAFRSKMLQRAAGFAFEKAQKRVSEAFEQRAMDVYGPPALTS